MKIKFISLSLLSLISLIMMSACATASAATPTAQETVLPVVRNSNLIIADGKVLPINHTNLSFSSSGVLSEVLVEEGQSVQKGQEIAVLGGSEQLTAEITAAELELLTIQQQRQDLIKNANLAYAEAVQNLATLEKELDKTTKQAASKEYKIGDQEQIDIAWANLVTAEDDVKQWEDMWNPISGKDENDSQRAAILSALAAARQVRDQAQANYNYLISKPNPIEVNLANANLSLVEEQVTLAQTKVEVLSQGADPEQLAKLDAQILAAQARLAAAEAGQQNLKLTAPFDGHVITNPLKTGELVSPGNPIVVVADLSQWKVETTDLTEINILGVQVGDAVTVRFDAIPDLEIPGTVERIRQIGDLQLGDITYTVVINLSEQDPRLMWNMTATIEFAQ